MASTRITTCDIAAIEQLIKNRSYDLAIEMISNELRLPEHQFAHNPQTSNLTLLSKAPHQAFNKMKEIMGNVNKSAIVNDLTSLNELKRQNIDLYKLRANCYTATNQKSLAFQDEHKAFRLSENCCVPPLKDLAKFCLYNFAQGGGEIEIELPNTPNSSFSDTTPASPELSVMHLNNLTPETLNEAKRTTYSIYKSPVKRKLFDSEESEDVDDDIRPNKKCRAEPKL